jgi:hypothetical protein
MYALAIHLLGCGPNLLNFLSHKACQTVISSLYFLCCLSKQMGQKTVM